METSLRDACAGFARPGRVDTSGLGLRRARLGGIVPRTQTDAAPATGSPACRPTLGGWPARAKPNRSAGAREPRSRVAGAPESRCASGRERTRGRSPDAPEAWTGSLHDTASDDKLASVHPRRVATVRLCRGAWTGWRSTRPASFRRAPHGGNHLEGTTPSPSVPSGPPRHGVARRAAVGHAAGGAPLSFLTCESGA